jgi:hypothetical protein
VVTNFGDPVIDYQQVQEIATQKLRQKRGKESAGLLSIYSSFVNDAHLCVDEENNIYCSFTECPVVRKYNGDCELQNEFNLSQISIDHDTLRKLLPDWGQPLKRNIDILDPYVLRSKNELRGVSVDKKYLYIHLVARTQKSLVLVFEKNECQLRKILEFEEESGKPYWYIDFSSPERIYAICHESHSIAYFNK